ncbi:MAG: hypothetical protein CMI79_04200 [Candidatus Pelagibacter sp.]|nr:hypothetical protein [Candidatus Pelagibacter sp.]|tara:strand:- start:2281 stop:3393 length:1113 start_codon:yes stop_codon:yes gene_type:complete
MHVLVFLTFGISFMDWEKSGLLSREILLYKKLNEEKKINFTFVTFGNSKDEDIVKDFNVIPYYKYNKIFNSKILTFFQSLQFAYRIKKLIDNPDLIKTNQLMGSWMGIICKFVFSCPLIIRTGYDIFQFSIFEKKRVYKKLIYFLLTQVGLLFSDSYTVSSNSDKAFLKKFFVGTNHISIIQNWVMTNSTKNKLINKKEKTILSVGRLEKQKNFTYLIKSFANSEYQLDIVGEGSEKKELIELSNKLLTNVNFLGTIDNKELLDLYKHYKYFISSSDYEGNSKTILEAKSAGCVVVARENKNNKEIIENQIDGVLYSDENLLNLINKLQENKELTDQISSNAIESVKNKNSINLILEKEYKNYEMVLTNY